MPSCFSDSNRNMNIRLRIEVAETGDILVMRNEDSIDQLKSELSLLTPIPPQEQILLFGPPFQVLDKHYSSAIDITNKRVFLYDRRLLVDLSAPIAPKLQPLDVLRDPTNIGLVASTIPDSKRHNLPPALAVYDKYFREQLGRAQAYDTFTRESIISMEKCVAQHRVQLDAMGAAVDNLKDTFSSVDKAYTVCKVKIDIQQSEQNELLIRFVGGMESLHNYSIHTNLLPFIKRDTQSTSRSNSVEGKKIGQDDQDEDIRTLFDCIVAEKEKMFYTMSKEHHTRYQEEIGKIAADKATLDQEMARLGVCEVDFAVLESCLEEARTLGAEQGGLSSGLRLHYRATYSLLSSFSQEDESDEAISTLCSELEQRKASIEQQSTTALMDSIAERIKSLKKTLETSQLNLLQAMHALMQKISLLQSEIQFKLKRGVDWMKKRVGGKSEYTAHLQQVLDLPSIYEQCLYEIKRRQSFNRMWKEKLAVATRQLNATREKELREREGFMQTVGVRLPPSFANVLSVLKDQPPVFHLTSCQKEAVMKIDLRDSEGIEGEDEGAEWRNSERVSEVTKKCSYMTLEYENMILRERVQSMERSLRRYRGKKESVVDVVDVATSNIMLNNNNDNYTIDEEVKEMLTPTVLAKNADDSTRANACKSSSVLIQGYEMIQKLLQEQDIIREMINYAVETNATSLLSDNGTKTSADEQEIETVQKTLGNVSRLTSALRYPLLSIMDFKVGDIALFMPANVSNNKKIWMAFNSNFPYRFLSEGSVQAFMQKTKNPVQCSSIIGRISKIQTMTAGDSEEQDVDYGLAAGTMFFICDAEPLRKSSIWFTNNTSKKQSKK